MITFLRYALLLMFCHSAAAQSVERLSGGQPFTNQQALDLWKKADSLTDVRSPEAAIEIYLPLIDHFRRRKDPDKQLTLINKTSLNYLRLSDHSSAFNLYTENDFESLSIRDSMILSDSYYYLAISRHYSGDLDEGIGFARQALKIRSGPAVPTDSSKIGMCHNILGVLNNQLGFNDIAVDHYQKYLSIFMNLPESDENLMQVANAYNNIGIIYTEHLKDRDRALDFYRRAIEIKKSVLGEDHTLVAESYLNTANILMADRPVEALDYLKKTIRIFEKHYSEKHFYTVKSYNSIADCYITLEQYDSAGLYLDKVLREGADHLGEGHFEVALAHSLKFCVYRDIGQSNQAEIYGERALELYRKYYPKGFEIAQEYRRMAAFYKNEGDLKKAFKYVNRSIGHILMPGADKDLSKVHFKEIIDVGVLVNALKLKAGLLSANEDLDSGSNAYDTYQTVIDIYSRVLQRYQSEYSNENIREDLYSTVEKALDQRTGTDESAYLLVQKSKNIFLRTYLGSLTDENLAEMLPDSIFQLEKSIRQRIEHAENYLIQARINGEEAGDREEEKLFQLDQESEEVRRYIRSAYPAYDQLKHGSGIVKVAEIQNHLSKQGQVLIEYFMGKEHIYLFVTTPEKFVVEKIVRDTEFDRQLAIYRSGLYDPDVFDPSVLQFNRFVKASAFLYQRLLKPAENLFSGKELIIIPDGDLSLIPFEPFLTHDSEWLEIDYKNLPYLIRDQVVSYANSAVLLTAGPGADPEIYGRRKGLLAFAPGSDVADKAQGLKPLEWAEEEVTAISAYFDSRLFVGERATEKAFREQAGGYSIIHIASHGLVSDEDPLYSRIAFTRHEGDGPNDGFLHSFELYNMHLDADLMVLSACHTGYGKVIKGEGVLNLARGCFYAGSKSVVMSLWVANDKAASFLMDRFYDRLSKGEAKNTALRSAKLSYLTANYGVAAHPYYWSQFVLSGNVRELNNVRSTDAGLYYGLALLALVGGVVVAAGRKRRKKSREAT